MAKLPPSKGGQRIVPPEAPVRFGYNSGAGATDHGALTGLADDDHSQYLTAAEGAAAYDAIGAAAAAVAAHEGAGDPHSTYLTAAEGNAAYQPVDADLTALAAAGNSGVLAATTASFTTADETKLDGIEAGATADQSNAEIETAYNAQVTAASQVEAEAGTEAAIRRFSPLRIAQAIAALAPAGGGVDTANGPLVGEFARFTDADTIEGRTASEVRTDLGLVIGTNVQAQSANLDEYAAVNPTAAGLALLDDADAAAQRTTMGAAATSHTHAIADLTDDGALAALNTVGTSQIDNDAVTFAKIQNVTDARLLGRSAGSSGDCQEITVGSGLSLAAGALTATGGGSDPWTYVALGSNFSTTSNANQNVTGLNFTPAANTRYHVEGYFLLRTATATVGARPGIAWPTGYSDGAAYTQAPNSLTAIAMQMGTPAAGTANAASTGLPVTARSYAGQMQAILIMGASPSGNFQITLASETAGTNVTMAAGSFIRYRTY